MKLWRVVHQVVCEIDSEATLIRSASPPPLLALSPPTEIITAEEFLTLQKELVSMMCLTHLEGLKKVKYEHEDQLRRQAEEFNVKLEKER